MDRKKTKTKPSDVNETIYVATHPTRLRILIRLESDKVYASKLEEIMKVDRKNISFHLSKLEESGLVTSEYGLKTYSKTRPMAVRYYSLTIKGEEFVRKLKSVLSELVNH